MGRARELLPHRPLQSSQSLAQQTEADVPVRLHDCRASIQRPRARPGSTPQNTWEKKWAGRNLKQD